MSDPVTPTTPTDPTPQAPKQPDVDPSWLNDRLERAQRSAEEKILKRLGITDLSAAEKAIKERAEQEQQAAIARGEAEKVINDLRPRAERFDAMDKFMREMVASRIEALPPQFKSLVPEYDDPLQTLKWLEVNAKTFAAPQAPNLDAGVTGDRRPNLNITPGQQSAASIAAQYGYNVKPEAVAKRQQEIDALRRNRSNEE